MKSKRFSSVAVLSVAFFVDNTYVVFVNARELRKILKKAGCEFETHKGGSGHITVTLNGKKTQLPMHGAAKELGAGLVAKILKDLGLK
jgi:mRNA interferase HicA